LNADYKLAHNDYETLTLRFRQLFECGAFGKDVQKMYENLVKHEEKIIEYMEEAAGSTGKDREKVDKNANKYKELFVNEAKKLLSTIKDYTYVATKDKHAYVNETEIIVDNLSDVYVIDPKGTMRRAYGTAEYKPAQQINCDYISIKSDEKWVHAVSNIGRTLEVDPADMNERFDGKITINERNLTKLEDAKAEGMASASSTFTIPMNVRVIGYEYNDETLDDHLHCPECETQFARECQVHGRPAYRIIGGKVHWRR